MNVILDIFDGFSVVMSPDVFGFKNLHFYK